MSRFSGRRLTVICILLGSCPLLAQDPVKNPATICSRTHLADSVSVDQFVFRTYKNDNSGDICLSVLNKGRVVFQRTNENGGSYTLGQKANPDTGAVAIANGIDITGRGHPDMIVSEYTGGAHCCFIQYVFELQPTFRLLATVDARDDDLSQFADLDNNGHYYYLTADWTFAYWPGSFAASPSAPVVLVYVPGIGSSGGYHLSREKMKKPAPERNEWSKLLKDARETFEEDAWNAGGSGAFWNMVMNLIYSGNSHYAWKLVSETWPAKGPDRNSWAHDFCSILKKSPYYADLDKPLDGSPVSCIEARPRR